MWKRTLKYVAILAFIGFMLANGALADDPAPDGWTCEAPREEIRPYFSCDATPGTADSVLSIRADDREGLMGMWASTIPIQGQEHYRFTVDRQTQGIALPRRTAIARIIWLNDAHEKVMRAEPSNLSYRPGERPRAEPEFSKLVSHSDGWDRLEGIYVAPPHATHARIELHFRWGEPHSTVLWRRSKL